MTGRGKACENERQSFDKSGESHVGACPCRMEELGDTAPHDFASGDGKTSGSEKSADNTLPGEIQDKGEAASIYCRLLGHSVPFSYCVNPGTPLFCRNIFGCWAGKMDIDKWVRERYTSEQIEQALRPSAAKLDTLLDLIRKAREADNRQE